VQMHASSLALDFLSSFSAFTGSGMKARLPPHPWVPVPVGWVVESGQLACTGQLSPSRIAPGLSGREFLNAKAGPDFCFGKCPSFSFACRALPLLHLPPPSPQGGTSPSLNHIRNPVAFAPHLLSFPKTKEEKKRAPLLPRNRKQG